MESHEVLKEAFDSPTTSPKEIAAELGVSLSLVYKWAQPPEGQGSGSRNPLDRVDELVRHRRPEEMALARRIKHALDPQGLLNPGKVLRPGA